MRQEPSVRGDERGLNSKNEFRGQLDKPGRPRIRDLANDRATDVAILSSRTEELRVVQRVENFHPEFEGFGFCQAHVFLDDGGGPRSCGPTARVRLNPSAPRSGDLVSEKGSHNC